LVIVLIGLATIVGGGRGAKAVTGWLLSPFRWALRIAIGLVGLALAILILVPGSAEKVVHWLPQIQRSVDPPQTIKISFIRFVDDPTANLSCVEFVRLARPDLDTVYLGRSEQPPYYGKAKYFLEAASAQGFSTGQQAVEGAVVVFDATEGNPYGHAAIVAYVRGNGSVVVQEANYGPGSDLERGGSIRTGREIRPGTPNHELIRGYVYSQ